MGLSKFAQIRPKHVQLSNKLPHNVCLCKYHENFMLALDAMNTVCDFPRYSHDFIETFICENPNKQCWLLECVICRNMIKEKLSECLQDCRDKNVSWFVWEDSDGKLSKIIKSGTAFDLQQHIIGMSKEFFEHSYIKRHQANCYQQDRNAVLSTNYDPSVAMIQVDFAENFTCIAQDEIQSFHWAQPQITLFTVSAWFMGEQHSMVIVSDNRNHNKINVAVFMDVILKELPNDIKKVHVWSDGPASQFKNRFIAETIKILKQRNNMNIIWNYFATSHGKGPVDGIGGALKRFVRNRVLRREIIVFNAEQFAAAAESSTVKIINVSPDQIEQTVDEMNLKITFDKAPAIRGIAKSHIIHRDDNNVIKTAQISRDLDVGIKTKQSYYDEVYGESSSESENDTPLSLRRTIQANRRN